MMKQLCLILLTAASLVYAVECDRTPSLAARPGVPPGKEVGVKRNSKYGLSALFYQNGEQKLSGYESAPDFMTLRDDRTGRESKPVRLPADYDNHQEVWSPDEEHMVFRCKSTSDGFCIYEASAVPGLLAPDGTFQTDKMSDYIRVEFTEFSPPQKGERKTCSHNFVKWEGGASFVFRARAYESKDGRGEFRYDAAGRKLYGVSGHSFDAENMRGKLLSPTRPGDVFTEQSKGGND